MTTKQRAAIEKHGRQVQAIFPNTTGMDPVDLCRKLRRIEVRANNAACQYCNGSISDEHFERERDSARIALDRILEYRLAGVPVFINGDPRGYALKIDDEYVREHNLSIHRDLGGYGIIAPEIDKDGN